MLSTGYVSLGAPSYIDFSIRSRRKGRCALVFELRLEYRLKILEVRFKALFHSRNHGGTCHQVSLVDFKGTTLRFESSATRSSSTPFAASVSCSLASA